MKSVFITALSYTRDYSGWAVLGGFMISAFHYLYGESEVVYAVMILLILLISADWLSGSRASELDGSYASEYGIGGVKRTAFLLLLPSIGHLIDKILNLPDLVFGLLAAGIGIHILKSMTANAVRAGWDKWVPNSVIEWVASEIEHKMARAMHRNKEREEKLKNNETDKPLN